jgi:hypothetical protein
MLDMRLYFDLTNHEYTLPDVYGIEVSDVDEARRVALDLIRKLREEDPSTADDWSGWRLSAVDPVGAVVLTLDLHSLA